MKKKEVQVSRKIIKEDRIAICPQFGCSYLKKVKPLKFGFIGFHKYPKCPEHKLSLIFIEEFVGDFLCSVIACLFDIENSIPKGLIKVIKNRPQDEIKDFINGWLYCISIGRGAPFVSTYIDGLSRAYMKLLSKKQRKVLESEKNEKKEK